MHPLRSSPLMARLILAWFVLTLGVAIASPMVNPQAMQLVCAGGSVKVVVLDDGEFKSTGHTTLDCPMCLSVPMPAAPAQPRIAQPVPLAHALEPLTAARIAALVGAPLPPRGPPSAS